MRVLKRPKMWCVFKKVGNSYLVDIIAQEMSSLRVSP